MASSRSLLLMAAVAFAVICLTVAQPPKPTTKPNAPPKPAVPPIKPAVPTGPAPPPTAVPVSPPGHSGGHGHTQDLTEVVSTEDDSPAAIYSMKFVAMFYGLLVAFVILWTVFFFLYFFEYGYGGDYYFWAVSYGTLVVIVCLGLSKYFTSSILAAALCMNLIFIPILAAGFMAMESVSSPDRFEGDKHNMGRTRLEGFQ